MRLAVFSCRESHQITFVSGLGCHDIYLIGSVVHKQVFAPFRAVLGVVTQQHMIEAEAKQLLRREQRHSRLLGRAVAFALIALDARGHQILRRVLAALRTREDVIKRQVFRMFVLGAILAAIAVANVNSRTLHRRLAAVAPQMNVVSQPDDRRHRKGRRRRMQNVITVILLDKDCSAKPQANRARDADRAERLVRKVQK